MFWSLNVGYTNNKGFTVFDNNVGKMCTCVLVWVRGVPVY